MAQRGANSHDHLIPVRSASASSVIFHDVSIYSYPLKTKDYSPYLLHSESLDPSDKRRGIEYDSNFLHSARLYMYGYLR